jgi:hypothetical protein
MNSTTMLSPPSAVRGRLTTRSTLAPAVLIGIAALLAVAAPSSAARQKTMLRQETQTLLRTGIPGAVVVTTQPGHVTRIATGVDLATTRRPMLASDGTRRCQLLYLRPPACKRGGSRGRPARFSSWLRRF